MPFFVEWKQRAYSILNLMASSTPFAFFLTCRDCHCYGVHQKYFFDKIHGYLNRKRYFLPNRPGERAADVNIHSDESNPCFGKTVV